MFASLIHGLYALFQAALDTLSRQPPFFAASSVHGLHFTICTPSILCCFLRGLAHVGRQCVPWVTRPQLGPFFVLKFVRSRVLG